MGQSDRRRRQRDVMRRPRKVAGIARRKSTADRGDRAPVSIEAPAIAVKASSESKEGRRFLITTGIALAGLIVAIVIPLYLGSSTRTPTQRVADCRHAHHLPVIPQPPALNTYDHLVVTGDCAWPPPIGAAADGFSSINLKLYNIPGSNSSQQFTDAIVATTDCLAVLMQLKFVDQETNEQEKPLLLANDQVVSGYDGSSVAIPNTLWPQIGPDSNGRLVILVNDRYDLSRLTCVNPAAPAN